MPKSIYQGGSTHQNTHCKFLCRLDLCYLGDADYQELTRNFRLPYGRIDNKKTLLLGKKGEKHLKKGKKCQGTLKKAEKQNERG